MATKTAMPRTLSGSSNAGPFSHLYTTTEFLQDGASGNDLAGSSPSSSRQQTHAERRRGNFEAACRVMTSVSTTEPAKESPAFAGLFGVPE
ncbi:hypothetical protein [Bradyrhizobium sp. STM 3843]|uniref:hypothetical protein n=1 Tax=Bradyrhizobium sp. STM 3843 TaxID=551947 RepID=UPI0011122C22|nr:hypothetical protein [Bradyrhizobium sp. STM 3843]